MKFLVDTNILLWFLRSDNRLSQTHRRNIEAPENEIFISIASLWEICIKSSLGKLTIEQNFGPFLDDLTASGEFAILGITAAHLRRLHQLPFHHRDPFDRIIISQSHVERMDLLYSDAVFAKYMDRTAASPETTSL